MNMLALVDEGKLPQDVWAGVSEIEKRWPAQLRFPLAEMIDLMVSKSDNTAVETLFRIGGGALAMARRFRESLPGKKYRATLRYLADPRDTGTPNGTVQLHARLFRAEALTPASTDLLIATLKATTTFPTRLKGLLPPAPSSHIKPVQPARPTI